VTSPPVNYDESLPPELLAGYVAPIVGAAMPATPPPPEPGPGSNEPEGIDLEPVEATRTDPGGPAVVAAPIGLVTARAGSPGSYDPPVTGEDRPSTIAELNARATADPPTPWAEETFVPYGNGKRAHWDGSEWRSHESPGYGGGGA
jgi:hypothetical protein